MIAKRRLNNLIAHFDSPPSHISSSGASSGPELTLTVSDGGGLLTPEQRQFYEDNGYLLIKGLVPLPDLEKYKSRFVDYATGKLKIPIGMNVMRDITQKDKKEGKGELMITKIQSFHTDEVLWEYCAHPEIIKYVECFTGPNLKAIHTMLVHKPPSIGPSGRHPFHQDLHYFPFRPADRIVAAWTAMERIWRDNGCLSVIPGSHKIGELKRHHYPEFVVNKAYHAIEGISEQEMDKRVHVPMEAGDTIFFHPLLWHGSGWNRTNGYRKAISCHYASSFCYYIDVKGTTQDELAQEVQELGDKFLKKHGYQIEFSFEDYWRYKSRLVKGKVGTL